MSHPLRMMIKRNRVFLIGTGLTALVFYPGFSVQSAWYVGALFTLMVTHAIWKIGASELYWKGQKEAYQQSYVKFETLLAAVHALEAKQGRVEIETKIEVGKCLEAIGASQQALSFLVQYVQQAQALQNQVQQAIANNTPGHHAPRK